MIYRLYVGAYSLSGSLRPQRVLVTRNRKAEGLGLPLPAGRVVLFGAGRERPILLGEGSVDDRAIGEDVEIEVGSATGVIATALVRESGSGNENIVELTVTNDREVPVKFELELDEGGGKLTSSTRLARRDGRPLWAVTVPANGSRTLSYRITSPS
jgi:hypothetical protein